jgi:hypothetical protein
MTTTHTYKSAKSRFLTWGFVTATTAAALASSTAWGQTASPVQSSADPFGLSIVAPVQAAGSDAASAAFDTNNLSQMRADVPEYSLTPGSISHSRNLHFYDPSQLILNTAVDARVYFLNDHAAYHNTLGFNTQAQGITSGNPQIIFADSSSNVAYGDTSWASATRTSSKPLLPGDFVDLGSHAAGTALDFFLIGDGARGGTNVYTSDRSTNPDNLNHMVAFSVTGSPYLMVGFEDTLGGGDHSFNNVLFAIDIGLANLNALTSAPEPALWLVLACCLLPVVWLKTKLGSDSSPTVA